MRDLYDGIESAIKRADVERVSRLLQPPLSGYHLRVALLQALDASAPYNIKDPEKNPSRLLVVQAILKEIVKDDSNDFGKRAAIFAKGCRVPYDTYKAIVVFFGLSERDLYELDTKYCQTHEMLRAPTFKVRRDADDVEEDLATSNKPLGNRFP